MGNFTDIQILKLFVDSAEELCASGFVSEIKKTGLSVHYRWSAEDSTVGREGPELDAVKAALLTLRFFGQNNESISLENMEKLINGMNIEQTLKESFQKSRSNFNLYLDSPPSMPFPSGCGADTRRQIFDTFLYGMFAHKKPEKTRRLERWKQEPFYEEIRMQFDRIILEYVKAISCMASVCKEYLRICPT